MKKVFLILTALLFTHTSYASEVCEAKEQQLDQIGLDLEEIFESSEFANLNLEDVSAENCAIAKAFVPQSEVMWNKLVTASDLTEDYAKTCAASLSPADKEALEENRQSVFEMMFSAEILLKGILPRYVEDCNTKGL